MTSVIEDTLVINGLLAMLACLNALTLVKLSEIRRLILQDQLEDVKKVNFLNSLGSLKLVILGKVVFIDFFFKLKVTVKQKSLQFFDLDGF